MKLVGFKQQENYLFTLTFENGESKETNLKNLLEKYIDVNGLNKAQLNKDWGCLEFNNGMVDIEPKTLYRYATQQSNQLLLTN
ncbi:conserved hypothetical protein [Crenothrix polyspora]|uniref:DUF2442 domain-containing protein n=1 Tax=Crenothrix polyspora TaxID=360316 RepID=A0A1R4H259_9GAMM|nr:DUF2442 domain-containing protein [Crenothrix polyspora]SJM90140.1 conserved hypothetical protein [Crenothrix polyspora]